MDLLSGIGDADQLISAREENKVLRAKVDELTMKVKELNLDNATLKAEVEIYRKEAGLPNFSKLALGKTPSSDDSMNSPSKGLGEEFISSGNGIYPTNPEVSLPNINGFSNPLCCALNRSDTLLASGGADSFVSVVAWGSALAPNPNAATDAVSNAAKVRCPAPVICLDFCKDCDIISAGCMDGSVKLIGYSYVGGKIHAWPLNIVNGEGIKYTKYVKAVAWSESSSIIASSSADGTAQLSKISLITDDEVMGGNHDFENSFQQNVKIEKLKSFHFIGAVEALCFVNKGRSLCLYERDTSYLTYFDLNDEYKMTKYSLNGSTTGGFDDFVSFAVMRLVLSPNGKYLCAATDASRNIIIEVGTDKIIRDLFGHKNDSYSQPRVTWSSNGQYIFGNTQEDCSICVWDIASSTIVQKLKEHTGQIRDMFSSKTSDTLITASYDKTVKVWLNDNM
mmetsp:Transcript_24625/g.28176  ORF Transcript_24625/g.28176 Transcript_24625/m.28176 type:complete len:451 (+) Transcript_24625:169-1521(+)